MTEVAAEKQKPRIPPTPVGRGLLLMLIGLGVGVAADRLLLAPKRAPEVNQSAAAAVVVQAPFTRVGDRIVVPPGSMLRSQLAVAEVTSQEVARKLVLPAVVEADPARTVKVLPPLSGRVVTLNVQLGGRVVKGQELAVIDSGDLAQAYSDIEKARSTVTLTKNALDRLMRPRKGRRCGDQGPRAGSERLHPGGIGARALRDKAARVGGARAAEGRVPSAVLESADNRQRHRSPGRARRFS